MVNNPPADKLRIVKTPLHKPSTAIAAVSTAFCGKKNGVTLHIEEQLLDSVTIRDARSGQLCFREADVVPSIFTQKTLLDADGKLIATITKER
ncbi:hypothetical protein Poli38472_013367 [Pythium oligandrum]|uniref:Uncharacterized protein n=1 Tax=Pythium oligandrum TaxID=41045 RepID=A0A8K1C7Y1_PYTOL|nr:hypothetical protein Poli38472_013367 [Pythium oligandrum]|eukprot:TMW57893.1 hypothetical protein Poli38472_013367 [Pythium oligandrum]